MIDCLCQIAGSESAPVQQLDDDADTREDQGVRTGVRVLATPAVRWVRVLATPAVRRVRVLATLTFRWVDNRISWREGGILIDVKYM